MREPTILTSNIIDRLRPRNSSSKDWKIWLCSTGATEDDISAESRRLTEIDLGASLGGGKEGSVFGLSHPSIMLLLTLLERDLEAVDQSNVSLISKFLLNIRISLLSTAGESGLNLLCFEARGTEVFSQTSLLISLLQSVMKQSPNNNRAPCWSSSVGKLLSFQIHNMRMALVEKLGVPVSGDDAISESWNKATLHGTFVCQSFVCDPPMTWDEWRQFLGHCFKSSTHPLMRDLFCEAFTDLDPTIEVSWIDKVFTIAEGISGESILRAESTVKILLGNHEKKK